MKDAEFSIIQNGYAIQNVNLIRRPRQFSVDSPIMLGGDQWEYVIVTGAKERILSEAELWAEARAQNII